MGLAKIIMNHDRETLNKLRQEDLKVKKKLLFCLKSLAIKFDGNDVIFNVEYIWTLSINLAAII